MDIKWFGAYSPEELYNPTYWSYSFLALLLFIFFVMSLMLVNVPQKFREALIYLLFVLGGMTIYGIGSVAINKIRHLGITNVFGELSVERTLAYGVGLGAVVMGLMYFTQLYTGQAYRVLRVQQMAELALIFSAVFVPIVEETLFNGILTPTLGTWAGAVAGLAGAAIMFFFFHFLALGLGKFVVLQLAVFRVLAGYFVFKYRNMGVGIIGHMLINVVAL